MVMKKLFNLSSGGDPLKNFIKDYKAVFSKIQGPKGRPVIIVMDNDDGFIETKKMLLNRHNLKFANGDQYIHVFDNLYILLSSLRRPKALHRGLL